ncbi:MAG: hypothetical protein JRI23_22880 [Deltaproteobacteria bacterium]|jgi:hypothetical protein|nr:hypothetical protein [Deltaproteobacteria bacterium]MBW2534814.1 hypothetical protein [Deltaproteobacteria bacterium]
MRSKVVWLMVGALGFAGCSDSEGAAATPDAGLPDGGAPDGSTTDAAPPEDAGTPDAAPPPWECPGNLVEVTGVAAGDDIQPAAQAAVDEAQDGDCVVLPAGEYALDGTLRIEKPVSLLGHGRGDGGTWLRRRDDATDAEVDGWGSMIRFTLRSRESSGIVLAGLRLSSKTPSFEDGDGGSLVTDTGVRFDEVVDFIVTDCRFEYFGDAALQIQHHDDLARGLIYENEFFHNLKGDGQGLGYGVALYGANDEWTADPEFGTDNFIFIEDNHFLEHRHSTAAGGCGRYVVRHNEIIDNLWGHAIDAHEGRNGGLGTSNHFSTRAVEAYDNEVRNDRFRVYQDGPGTPIEPGHNLNDLVGWAMMFRGGEVVAHHNRIEGYLIEVGVTAFLHSWPDVYPLPTQIGYASGLALGPGHSGTGPAERDGDVFVWEDDYVPYVDVPNYDDYQRNHAPDYLTEGRDYHFDVARPDYTPYEYPHPARIEWAGLVSR